MVTQAQFLFWTHQFRCKESTEQAFLRPLHRASRLISYLEAGYRCPETEGNIQHASDAPPVRKDSVDEFGGSCSNYLIIVTFTMQCNQLPANCRISPMTSITREAVWDSISIKSLRQYKPTHLWGVARQVLKEEAEVGKVPRGKGRALAKPNRWWDTETRMQEGGFPGIHTSLAFCWGVLGAPHTYVPTLMTPAHRHCW